VSRRRDGEPGAIRIGTSGWHYPHWRGPFYPPALAREQWLAHYATRFDCVEVNASFYRLPEPGAIARWCAAVPEGFLFAVKAPRAITHLKKLKGCEQALQELLARLALFGDHLGPLLFQLPPRWRVNLHRLEAFLAALPAEGRFVLEFREPSWHCPEVRAALAAAGVSWCLADPPVEAAPGDQEPCGPCAYLRLHGPRQRYRGSYRSETLRAWAGRLRGWSRKGLESYCFLDNDERAHAPRNAAQLRRLLAEHGSE